MKTNTIDLDGLPHRLAELPDCPARMFVRGSIPTVPMVAVVGTRTCTRYGRGLARAFGSAIATAGWCLVSGLARGIDAEAHRGTVASRGLGVAVLGSGLDVWYPAEHQVLGEQLVELGGAVISEYKQGTAPERWHFPRRNRIISGLAQAVVVVEAGLTGGALITASLALDQGRPVFVVPGDVDRPASEGCNRLLRDGAHPVLGPEDLVEELSLVLGPPLGTPGRSADDELVAAVGDGIDLATLAVRMKAQRSEVRLRVARLQADQRLVVVGDDVRPCR